MYVFLTFTILLSVICPLTTAYTCSQISQFYIDCLNLYTFRQSVEFCSQYGMSSLNVTNPAIFAQLNQTLQLIN
jgi:hypothetical protein